MSKNINAEIVAVGTELLLGQIANTNAQWISQILAQEGINTLQHSVVGDNIDRVEKTFRQAEERSNVIIVTGGLGPTDDDLTREAFQLISNEPLITDQPSMDNILDYFNQQTKNMTSNNRKQARVFASSKVIKNQVGMAPGMIVKYNGRIWIFLPGVPPEMKQMVVDVVIPYLRTVYGEGSMIRSEILRFLDIGEAELEDRLSELIKNQSNPTIALLAQKKGLIIRLTAKADTKDEADQLLKDKKSEIDKLVGYYIYGTGYETIDQKVVELLKHKKLSISSAESLTGGMFTEKIINQPGASEICPGGIVSYSPAMKHKLLGVSQEIIDVYGTVSEQCASQMAIGVSSRLKTDFGISFTGVAGPDSSEGLEPGTVFISVYNKLTAQFKTEKYVFPGDRNIIRNKTVNKGFEMLYYFIKNQ